MSRKNAILLLFKEAKVEAVKIQKEVIEAMEEVIRTKKEALVIKKEVLVIEEKVEGMVKEANCHFFQEKGQEVISISIPINKALTREMCNYSIITIISTIAMNVGQNKVI